MIPDTPELQALCRGLLIGFLLGMGCGFGSVTLFYSPRPPLAAASHYSPPPAPVAGPSAVSKDEVGRWPRPDRGEPLGGSCVATDLDGGTEYTYLDLDCDGYRDPRRGQTPAEPILAVRKLGTP